MANLAISLSRRTDLVLGQAAEVVSRTVNPVSSGLACIANGCSSNWHSRGQRPYWEAMAAPQEEGIGHEIQHATLVGALGAAFAALVLAACSSTGTTSAGSTSNGGSAGRAVGPPP